MASISLKVSMLAIFIAMVVILACSSSVSAQPDAPFDVPVEAPEEEEDPCAAEEHDPKKYNMGLRIGSVFIVFGVSGLGIIGAIFISLNKTLSKKQSLLFVIQFVKFFGIGVILATAWIHLLTPAYEAFSNPCLLARGKWERYGISYVGLFGMIATFFVQGFQFCALSRGDSKAKAKAKQAKKDAESTNRHTETTALTNQDDGECTIPHSHTHEHDSGEHQPHKPKKEHDVSLHDVTGHSHDVVSGVLDDGGDSSIGTIFLELGILFHSVIIGLALGTATDEFKSLLIAICFHQFFEGIALGVRISEIKYLSSLKKVLMAFFYPITTPIGIAIGIGIRKSYNENAFKALLTQGIFDSLSAGILFYTAYVELMAFEMNRNAVFRAHNTLRKAALFFAVYLGAAGMAVIGLWA